MFATLKNKLDLIFTKSWYFLRPKNKLGLVSFVILSSLFVTAWFVFTPVAHALLSEIGAGIRDMFSELFLALAGFFIKLTFFVLKFIIEIAGYNGYIDSPAVTVGWVMIRDMTNMIFIVVLLIISFGTILGLEHYEWKKMLVKVIMAAVIVNFSRIICGVIIDIAQVVMLTFVNGIAATASGNVVNMFNVQDIFKLGSGNTTVSPDGNVTFLASVAALVFGTMMLVTMATFLLLLMARMAMLWVLIVLSPFAFVLNVLPQTEKYASQWWGEFGGNVIAGPIVVFFLWLSFVTVGTGTVHDDIKNNNALKNPENLIGVDPTDPKESTGITNIMSWEKMANFVIAIAMLLAGAKMATELGAAGGEMMGKAKDIGKKVAMYASGYQAARWGAGKAWEGTKLAGKGLYYGLSVVPGINAIHPERWKERGKRMQSRVKGWYADRVIKGSLKAKEVSNALKVDPKTGKFVKNGTEQKKDKDGNLMFERDGTPIMKTVDQGGWFSRDMLKRSFARFRLETGSMGDYQHDVTEVMEETAELKNKQREHFISTSSLPFGQAKQKAKEQLRNLEHTGHDISEGKEVVQDEKRHEINHEIEHAEEKIASIRNNASLTDAQKNEQISSKLAELNAKLKKIGLNNTEIEQAKSLYDRQQNAMQSKAKKDVIGGNVQAAHNLEEKKALEKYLTGQGAQNTEASTAKIKAESKQIEDKLQGERELKELESIRSLLEKNQASQESINKIRAQIESGKESLDLTKNRGVLQARADQYTQDGDYLRAGLAQQQADTLELNKLRDIFKTAQLGPVEQANLSAQIIEQMQGMRNERERLGVWTQKDDQKYSGLVRQKAALHDLVLTQDYFSAAAEQETGLRQIGWDEERTDDNAARRDLSLALGRKVNAGEEVAAKEEFKNLLGGEKAYKAHMRQRGAHAKNQQGNGNANAFIYSNEAAREGGRLNGQTDYDYNFDLGSKAPDMREWLGKRDLKPQQMRLVAGSRSALFDAAGNAQKDQLIRISEDQASFNAEALGSYDERAVSSMDDRKPFLDDLNNSAIQADSAVRQLKALAKLAKDDNSFVLLCGKKLNNLISRLGYDEAALRTLHTNRNIP